MSKFVAGDLVKIVVKKDRSWVDLSPWNGLVFRVAPDEEQTLIFNTRLHVANDLRPDEFVDTPFFWDNDELELVSSYVDEKDKRIAELEQQIANVRAAHKHVVRSGVAPEDVQEWCHDCDLSWPCPTIAALDGPAAPPQEPQPTPEARLCCEHCQPDSGEETRYCDRTHCDSCAACAARQQDEEAQGMSNFLTLNEVTGIMTFIQTLNDAMPDGRMLGETSLGGIPLHDVNGDLLGYFAFNRDAEEWAFYDKEWEDV